ncbi:MAG: hypothetical protein HN600_15710 [Bacteroidetes bacterium]|jgi:hypothetical protein|nr:hypothetical protein [Candidatus Scalindua sp.]MBT7828035.1 hypothetical protein [Bacteroidota bacterium]
MKHSIVSIKDDLGWCEFCEEWHFLKDVENGIVPEHDLVYIKGDEVWCKKCDDYHKIDDIEDEQLDDLPGPEDLYSEDPDTGDPFEDIDDISDALM